MTTNAAEADLGHKRDRVARELAELQYDLGGLAYEMAIRDHFRLDALVRIAARMQELDGELGELERLIALKDAGASGACVGCGALHGRSAFFCWKCGTQLVAETNGAGSSNADFTSDSPRRNTQ
jgi:hypothetical protein